MPVPQNAQVIWNFLIKAGFNDNAAAGILGNIEQESGGSVTAGSMSSGYGLIQWTPGSAYASEGIDSGSEAQQLTNQLAAIITYIKANGSISAINAASTSPQAAALYFSTNYERPDPALANNANREASAEAVLQAAKSGNWPSGSGTTSSDSTSTDSLLSSGGFLGDLGSLLGLSGAASFAGDLDSLLTKILWLFNPASWVRIGSFLVAIILLIVALIIFTKADQKISAPVPVPVPV